MGGLLRGLACGCLTLLFGHALAVAPPLTAEQKAKMQERDAFDREATELEKAGKFTEALVAAGKALAIERAILGTDADDTLGSLTRIARLQETKGDWDAAIATRKEIVEARIRRHGPTDWQVINARLASEDGLRRKGWDAAQRAKWAAFLAAQDQSVREYRAGKYADGIRSATNATDLARDLLGETHPDYTTSLSNLAELYRSQGQFSQAELLSKKALEICRVALGEVHPDTALCLNNLAALYKSQSQYAKAEPLYIKALAIYRTTLGESHLEYATSLNNLAALYQSQGQYAKAEPLYIQASDLYRTAFGETHPSYATCLNNLAALYQSQGQSAKAEPLYEKALEIRRVALGEAHPSYAMSLNNLAAFYDSQDQSAKAEPLYEKALEIRRVALGEAHPSYAMSLNNLAALYDSQGKTAKAELLYTKASDIYRTAFGENHPDYATSLNNLAMLYRTQGQYAKAEPLATKALDICRTAFGENHPAYATSLNNLAMLYRSQGRQSQADPLFFQAVRIITEHLDRNAESQVETEQFASAAKNRFFLDTLLASTAKALSIDAYEPALRVRGAVTARQAFLRAVSQCTPEAKPLADELQAVTGQMSRLVNAQPDRKAKVDTAARLTVLTERYERLQRELAAKSNAFAHYRERKRATSADLRKALPANAVLVDFLTYHDRFQNDVALRDRLCAFVVTPQGVQRVELGPLPPIADAVDRFRGALGRFTPLTGKLDDPALVLRDRLWAPVAKEIGAAKLVLICPDGPLCRLPFAALPSADGTKYLIEEIAIGLMPVPQQLFELTRPAEIQKDNPIGLRPISKGPPSLLVVGDVDFAAPPQLVLAKEPEAAGWKRKRAGGRLSWPPLPATREEVVAIADSYRTALPDGKVTSLRGRDATEEAVRAVLSKAEFVHLATHGYFSAKELTVQFAAPERGGEVPRGPLLHAGLLSGVVCSGANTPVGEDDGVLTALELGELDLSRVELAVLSACETGLGETAGGEGVLGLQRALQLAGAKTSVTSLWKVNDAATQKLMTRFYANYFSKDQNLGTLESLREAQLWMLQEGVTRGMVAVADGIDKAKLRSPPAFWAAFSLAGDWR